LNAKTGVTMTNVGSKQYNTSSNQLGYGWFITGSFTNS
jgi:hypothetical protein